jgi:cytidylate kinase
MIITVSRQAATNGGLIGRIVAKRLGLHVFDRELVDEIAWRMEVDPNIVVPFDESVISPVQSILAEWRHTINESIYQRHLREALERIAHEGNAVIIGRGANFVLQCPACLHVRIVAPVSLRVGIYRTVYPDVPEEEAQRRILDEDRDKARFIDTHYHASIDDPQQYDLVFNLAGLIPETVIDLIAAAAQTRGKVERPHEPHALLPDHVRIMTRHRRPPRPEVVEEYRFEP